MTFILLLKLWAIIAFGLIAFLTGKVEALIAEYQEQEMLARHYKNQLKAYMKLHPDQDIEDRNDDSGKEFMLGEEQGE